MAIDRIVKLMACQRPFLFNPPTTTEIYTLSLHDALPICLGLGRPGPSQAQDDRRLVAGIDDQVPAVGGHQARRSEEHTSELQSHSDLVCRLLLEKKKRNCIWCAFQRRSDD